MALLKMLRWFYIFRSTLIIIIAPCAYLPIFLMSDSKTMRCAYGMAVMATYWISEALPIAVTALLPVVLFPLMGVLPVKDVCSNYIKDVTMFGIGCLSFALAIERWNLHKRLALRTLLLVGTDTKWLMLGFMLPTWFLSLWVNNTSATALLLPVLQAVLSQLRSHTVQSDPPDLQQPQPRLRVVPHDEVLDGDEIVELNPKSVTVLERPPRKRPPRGQAARLAAMESRREHEYRRLCKGMSLCVAYAANIGGTGSVTGTSTNLITQGQIHQLYGKFGLDSGLNFSSWMAFALPSSLLTLLLAWLWLALLFLGPRKVFRLRRDRAQGESIKKILRDEYERLGSTSFAEYALIGHFLALVLLWLSRKPPTGNGWDSLFPEGYVGDSAAAVLICVSMFIFPASRPRPFSSSQGKTRRLLNWGELQARFPWGVIVLLGGGFALADVCQKSGLSETIGERLAAIGQGLEPWMLNLALTFTFSIATEVTSNSATAALLVPILGQLALNLSMNPLYLMLPAGLSTSFAFMLPVATPPNALVFATGHLQVKDMVLAGAVLNVLAVAVLNVAVNTWGSAFFHWTALPPPCCPPTPRSPWQQRRHSTFPLATPPSCLCPLPSERGALRWLCVHDPHCCVGKARNWPRAP